MIIIEGILLFFNGFGYVCIFGFFNEVYVVGWKLVIDVVYVCGGKIVV